MGKYVARLLDAQLSARGVGGRGTFWPKYTRLTVSSAASSSAVPSFKIFPSKSK